MSEDVDLAIRRPLQAFRALTFDCYGTLIDWETGIFEALQPLLRANGRGDLDRDALLTAYGSLEHQQESAAPDLPYEQVLARVHHALAARFDLETTPELDRAFAASLPSWPAFPDTADALRFLASRYKLVILSNVSRAGIQASIGTIGIDFDAVYTAEEIGSYKPSLANFEYMLSRLDTDLGIAPTEVLHTAQSLFHDHVPAKSLGLATAWIDRQRLSEGGRWGATAPVDERPEPDYVFLDLETMARAVRDATHAD